MPRRFTFMEWQELAFSPGPSSLQLKPMQTRLTTTLPWVIFSACASFQSFFCVWILPLKDDAVKALYSICQQIWKAQQWPQDWKRSVFIPIPKKRQCQRMLKLLHNALISQASKVMLKILQARLQQYMNRELPDVQVVLEKAEEPEIKLPISAGSSKKQESSRKTSISALLTMPKPLTVWTTTNSGKFFKRWKYQTTWPASWEICVQVKKQQLELYM